MMAPELPGRWARRVLVAASVAALLAPATAAGYTDQQAVADLNAWRAEVGVPAVTSVDAEMSEGCRLHNNYMALNGLTHNEEPSKPGYTELGARAGAASNLGMSTVAASPRVLWEEGIYHRTLMLAPRLRTGWYAASSGFVCGGGDRSDPAGTRTPTLVPFPSPANGAQGVPISFRTAESPDPRQAIPGNPQEPGWLLSVQFNGPWEYGASASVTSASLAPDGGAPVAVTPQDSGSPGGQYLGGGVAVFPHAPLARHTWYTARVTGTKSGQGFDEQGQLVTSSYPFDVSWRFKSGVRKGENPSEPDGKAKAAKRMRLSISGKLRGRKLALKVGAGKGARGRRASVRLHTPKRVCKRKRGSRRRTCRTVWRALGRKKAVKLSRASSKRSYKVSRRHQRIRATVTVSAYRTKAGERWKTTAAKRIVRRR